MEYILCGEPVPEENKINYNSVGSMFLDRLRKAKDQIDGSSSEKLTASQILYRSAILANRLLKYGIKRGDIIGIYSENCFEYIYAVVATFSIGAIITLYNPSYKSDELSHVIDLAKPKLIFTSASQRLINVTAGRSFVEKIVDFCKVNSTRSIESYNDFIKNVPPMDVFPCESMFDCLEDVVIILYSSGTTGIPKGVLLMHRNIFGFMERVRLYSDCRSLSFLPWCHVYGFTVMMLGLITYKNSVILRRFEEKLFLSCIPKYKINIVYAVPAIVAFLAKSPLINEYDLSSITGIQCGGAPLPKNLVDVIKYKYNAFIKDGYGMTETTAGIIRKSDTKNKFGSIGSLTYETFGKVIDIETGKSVGPNQVGELCFKGPTIMKGYLNNETETKNIIDEDGWIHTGDIGYFDEDEVWFIVDRIKELIKYKGLQVAPAELETVLMNHPKIMDAACIGVPDEVAGELPMAFVVLKAGLLATEKEIQDYVAERVSSAKHLRGGVKFVNSIPRNDSGKILRRILRDDHQKQKSKL